MDFHKTQTLRFSDSNLYTTLNSTISYNEYQKLEKEALEFEKYASESRSVANYAEEIAKRSRIKAINAKKIYEDTIRQEKRDKKALVEIEKLKIILQTRLELDSQGLLYYLYIDEINKNSELSKKRDIQEEDLKLYLEGYEYLRFIRVYITFEDEFNPLGQSLYRFFKCNKFDNLFDIIDRLPYKDKSRMQYLLFLLSLDSNQFKHQIDKDIDMDDLTKIENYLEYFNRIFELARWIKYNFDYICENCDLFDINALLEPSLAVHVV